MRQKAILAGVNLNNSCNFESSMEELGNLAAACDIEVAGQITQKLSAVNISHYIGTGKIPETASLLAQTGAGTVIFNDELSPSQIRNLEKALECAVKDRTMLILEIFALRARTTEAKLQVEVANLQYMLPRLAGLQASLEQQTGGVGTTNRGAGEKQLELNRRQIKDRISRLNSELETLVGQRQIQRRQRKKNNVPAVSLVGYTNAGKSTIMNALLGMFNEPDEKKVFEKDMLFATLETSVRSITLPDNKTFLLTDTVGFIDKLPHHLVKAFHSTLEQVGESDLLIHVVDSSNADYKLQIDVTNETLKKLGVENIPVIYAFNKSDLMDIRPSLPSDECVCISAKNGSGLDELMERIRSHIFGDYIRCEMLIPYSEGEIISYFNENAHVISTGYEHDGTRLVLDCKKTDYGKYQHYVLS